MPDASPPLTIGLPVYNGEGHVGATLDDIAGQSFGDFNLIISDNASTDRTSEICRDYAARDPRIRYHRNPRNLGLAPNFNRVFELCDTRYFKWICHDDRHASTFLERCIDVLERDSQVVGSFTGVGLIGQYGEQLRWDEKRRTYLDSCANPVYATEVSHIGEGPTPQHRFRDVLHHMSACNPFYSVFRSDVLRRIAWRKNYFGHDKVVLAEIVLLGRLNQVGETLFFKRWHKGQSIDHSTKEKAEIINPDRYSGNPQMLMLRDYVVAIWRTPFSPAQRAHMLWTIARMIQRPGLMKKVFVPGPHNYFGIEFRRASRQLD